MILRLGIEIRIGSFGRDVMLTTPFRLASEEIRTIRRDCTVYQRLAL